MGNFDVIQIRAVRSRRDQRAFVAFPYLRYRGNAHWVPPLRIAERARLDRRRNPFFEHAEMELFLAVRDGRTCGRIAAIDDHRHQEIHRDSTGMFGFFEATDEAAAQELLAAAEDFARARGRRIMRGPLNPSMNDSAGILIDGFDSDPMVMMPYNPPSYAAYLERAGYAKAKDLFAWIFDVRKMPQLATQYQALLERLQARHRVVFGRLGARDFEGQLSNFWQVYCRAWERNWGFVPPTDREFRYLARELKPIVDFRFTITAEVDGTPIGCAVAVPDINQVLQGAGGNLLRGLARYLRRKSIITQGRVLLVGILPEYQRRGLFPLLVNELYRRSVGTQYQRVECSWVLEDNLDINGPAELFGGRRYKTYRLYEKAL